jgi:hypothetical protein
MDRVQRVGAPSLVHVTDQDAIAAAQGVLHDTTAARAVDLVWRDGHPAYVVHLADTAAVVDAANGAARAALDDASLRVAAAQALGVLVPGAAPPVERVTALSAYDDYYYAGHGRGVVLPVVRVQFADANRSALYLDPLTGLPRGVVDASSRQWRWWRDALHTFDIPALNNKRPLWDIVTLIPMLGGTLAALTGVWLLLRRLGRIAAKRTSRA